MTDLIRLREWKTAGRIGRAVGDGAQGRRRRGETGSAGSIPGSEVVEQEIVVAEACSRFAEAIALPACRQYEVRITDSEALNSGAETTWS